MSVRNTRRRQRRPDALASPAAVRAILDQLHQILSPGVPLPEKKLISLVRAARHIERYPASDTRRGRPSRFDRVLLIQVASHLRLLLERETQGRISLSSFVDHYLRILDFPADLVEALERDDINLFEAEQLARLTPARLGISEARARRTRMDMIETHLQARLSGARLNRRIQQMLSPAQIPSTSIRKQETTSTEWVELEDFDPHDPTHLFYDEIKRLGFALREIGPQDLTDDLLEEYLKASEHLWNVLVKIEKRKQSAQHE
jgi:hypothetical protein